MCTIQTSQTTAERGNRSSIVCITLSPYIELFFHTVSSACLSCACRGILVEAVATAAYVGHVTAWRGQLQASWRSMAGQGGCSARVVREFRGERRRLPWRCLLDRRISHCPATCSPADRDQLFASNFHLPIAARHPPTLSSTIIPVLASPSRRHFFSEISTKTSRSCGSSVHAPSFASLAPSYRMPLYLTRAT